MFMKMVISANFFLVKLPLKSVGIFQVEVQVYMLEKFQED